MLRSSVLVLSLALLSLTTQAKVPSLSEQLKQALLSSENLKDIGLTIPADQKFPVGIPSAEALQVLGMINPATAVVMALVRQTDYTTKFNVEYRGETVEIRCAFTIYKPAHKDQFVKVEGCYDGGKLRGIRGIDYEYYSCSNSQYMLFNGSPDAVTFTRILK